MNTKNDLVVRETLKEYSPKLLQPETCKKCGGRCCKQSGCECHPIDFDYDQEKMYKALTTGNYSISLLTTDWGAFKQTSYGVTLNRERIIQCINYALYIRMRNKDRPIVDLIHMREIEGPCSMLKEDGCSVSFEERPLFGKLLHTVEEHGISICKSPLSRDFLYESWKDYQEILLTYAEAFLTVEDIAWYRTKYEVPFYL